MKTVIKIFYATLILMIFTGCSTESLDGVKESSPENSSANAQRSVAEAGELTPIGLYFGEGSGTATLRRNQNGISVQVHSTGLTSGNAYTAWFIVFEGGNPPIVVNAAGHVVGGNGNATFAGHLSTGEVGTPNGTTILGDGGDGSFDDPMGCFVVIHIVDHDVMEPGNIPVNIHEITGAVGLSQEWIFDGI